MAFFKFFGNTAGARIFRPAVRCKKQRLACEMLEDRCLLAVLPAANFVGLNFGDTPGYVPPDTIAAAGTTHLVETVNTTLAVYNKTGGAAVVKRDLGTFFSTNDSLSDPVVTYDEQAGKFFVAVLDFSADRLLYARFSDTTTGDPSQSGVERGQVTVTDAGSSGDYPRLGWNADAYVVSLNMFSNSTGGFDHVRVVTIPKSAFTSPKLADPFGTGDAAGNNFTLSPTVMHGSAAGSPMYFVDEAGYGNGGAIRVVKETNLLTTPTYTSYIVGVAGYTEPPAATQRGSSNTLETNDSRILNAEWRNNTLVAAQTIGLNTDAQAHARWYEFNTASTPVLTQQGTIGAGSGANSYFPAVGITGFGGVGMSFIESSSTEYVSMYVTGATYRAIPFAMTMQTPVIAQAGQATYHSFEGTGPFRAGDYSGLSIDPIDGSFWAANEYATNSATQAANWGTKLIKFSLTAPPALQNDISVTAISTAVASVARNASTTVTVGVANAGTASATFVLSLTDTPVSGGVAGSITPTTFTITLAPGASTTRAFTFSAGSNTKLGSHVLTASAALAGDQNVTNNSISTSLSVTATAGSTPLPPALIYHDVPLLAPQSAGDDGDHSQTPDSQGNSHWNHAASAAALAGYESAVAMAFRELGAAPYTFLSRFYSTTNRRPGDLASTSCSTATLDEAIRQLAQPDWTLPPC